MVEPDLDGFFVEDFENVVPEFSQCGDTQEHPSLQHDIDDSKNCNDCQDCECKPTKEKEEQKPPLKHVCYKCHTERATIKIKQEAACQHCFLYTLTHKFKNSLVRHCKTQKDSPLLCCISGGPNSMSMLHLLYLC